MSEEEKSKPYTRAENSPMKREAALQMWAGMNHANLLNCSPGRNIEHTAVTALDHAEGLWKEWIKRCPSTGGKRR